MEPQDRNIHIYFTDPDATDSYTDFNSDSFERSQHKRFSKTIVIPQSITNQSQNQNQNSSKYKGVTLRKSGKWGAQIRDPICRRCVWLGVFPSEEEAHQAYQAAYDRIEKENAQIDQEAAVTQCQLFQTVGQQCQSCQKASGGVNPQSIPSQSQNQNQNQKKNQNSSKYKGVTLRESGKWAAQIWDRGVYVWLGTFPLEEEAHQAYQAAHIRIKDKKGQISQGKKAELCQKGEERRGAAAIQIKDEEKAEKEVTTAVVSPPVKKRKRTKKGKEKVEKEVTTAVVSPPVKKRKRTVSKPPVQPQSFVSREKQRNNISSDNPTSGADIRTGSTSPVHNTSARPPGFLEEFLEALTDVDLKTGDFEFDSENDLIQVDHRAGNSNWDDFVNWVVTRNFM